MRFSKTKRSAVAVAVLAIAATATDAVHAGLLDDLRASFGGSKSVEAGSSDSSCQPEQGFSPEGSAQRLVLRAIDSAQHSIRLAAYSFTSREVVRHLVEAKSRGVDVAVVVDEKNNLVEDRSGKARAALNLLVNARIPTRTLGVYAIAHDKYFVVDGYHLETGSYNFSDSAARRNSENVLLLWRCPSSAKDYLDHWNSRWDQGVDYRSTY
ncbi:phosphatidylserine/phosphatidylglycerophosphate/cardiolipin synthase-like enzyme [Paraburkholderia sp. GAS33]|uniref:phospholipase D family nuclease n=1 Tax=Paraburkholderia sp. GAS33 TaxID=3035130 RepID=UPI003D1BBEA3